MYTLVETPTFVAEADKLWDEDERLEFFTWLAVNPEAGLSSPAAGVAARFAGHAEVPGSAVQSG